LRALAKHAHEESGGPGVGVVGMCFTGGFALAMMVDDVVLAPVLSQPGLPMPIGTARKRDLGISDDDLARIKQRCAEDAGLCVLGLRFTNDKTSPAARFQHLREELGDRFVAVEIDSSPGNPHGHPAMAHSVLTEHLEDREGTPTRDALDKVLELFRSRLVQPSAQEEEGYSASR
jgi:dienelactone hydrolase